MKNVTKFFWFSAGPFALTIVVLVLAYLYGNITFRQAVWSVSLSLFVLLAGYVWALLEKRIRMKRRRTRVPSIQE